MRSVTVATDDDDPPIYTEDQYTKDVARLNGYCWWFLKALFYLNVANGIWHLVITNASWHLAEHNPAIPFHWGLLGSVGFLLLFFLVTRWSLWSSRGLLATERDYASQRNHVPDVPDPPRAA